ncbi:MAG: glycosyltransferase [Bacteroidetes bacterium]|nr:glycosyltransferase [Bacteroidota bacterium]
MKNILYISYDGMTDPLGQSQVLPYLCGLSLKGYNISIISAEKPEKYILLKDQIQKICNTHHISWHPIYYTKYPPVLSTIIDIIKIRISAIQLFKSKRFDIIHCRSYISSVVAIMLKKKYDFQFLFDMRGFWVDEKVDGNIWNLKNPIFKIIFRYMKIREKEFFNRADHIVTLTRVSIPTIKSIARNKDLSNKITVIPCCVDVNHFDRTKVKSVDVESWKSKLNIQSNDYILAYLGSLSTWYLPEEMLRLFLRFRIKVPHAKFLIITTEDAKPFIKMAERIGVPLDSLIFTSSNRSELPSLLSLCNTSLFFIKPAFSKIASSPTKLGELLSMGIPVICNTGIGDTDEMIISSQSGVICKSFDEKEYDRCSEEILNLEKTLDKELTRSKAIELFSLENGVNCYHAIYQKLIAKNDGKVHS